RVGARVEPGDELAGCHIPCLDCQIAPRGHRIPRIESDVQQRTSELTRAQFHMPHVCSEPYTQLDVLAKRSSQHRLGARDDGVWVDELGRDERLPAEGEELAGQRRGLFCCEANLLEL